MANGVNLSVLHETQSSGVRPDPLARPSRIKAAVVLGLLAMMLEGYETGALGNVVPVLSAQWHLTPQSFTWALAASSIGMVIGAVAGGILANHLGRKPVLIASVALFAIGSLLCAATNTPAGMGWMRVITGLGMGAIVPMVVAASTAESRGRRQGLLVMTTTVGLPVGQIVGGLLTAWLIQISSWQVVFLFGGAVSIVVLIPLLWALFPTTARAEGPAASMRGRDLAKLFTRRRTAITVLLWVIVSLNFTCNYFVISWLPTILNTSGMQASGAISFATLYPFGAVLAIFLFGWLLDSWGMEKTLTLSLLAGAIAVVFLGIVHAPVGVMALLVAVLGIGVAGSQGAINALTARVYPQGLHHAGSGWALGVGRIGNAIGPLIGGALIAAGLTPPQLFIGLGIGVFLTAVVMSALGAVRHAKAGQEFQITEEAAL